MRRGVLLAAAAAIAPISAIAGPPPAVSLVELTVRHGGAPGRPPIDKLVRVAHPAGWTGDMEADGRMIRLFGPDGEGELLIAAVSHPSELGPILDGLRKGHPGAAPSPPNAMDVPGVNPEKGERATRFIVTGREVGELVTIERGELIVLFATLVAPNAWADVEPKLKRCYPTVEVVDRPKRR